MTIECPKCRHENPDETAFCGKCGIRFDSDVGPTKTLETPKEELTTGSTFAGRYQIIEELGKGGMGRVYKATDTRINEKVALKLIKPEIASDKKTLERFGNELRMARKITHKNIGKMFDINEEAGTHFITMEYVPGQDLKRLIRQSGNLAINTSISIAKQICDGLSEAHKTGVVHRDLKPSNIMIDREGHARIMDFGIARSLKEKGITGAGVMIGTPEYMSPEQAEAKEVDRQSDIYSLGVVLYEMTTGRLPFEGDTPLSVAMKHKGESPKNPKELNPQIPDDLAALILKCLEKDKESRYQTSGELREALDMIEEGLPTTDKDVPRKKSLTSKEITVQFSLKKIFIPAFVVIAFIILGLILWNPWKKKEFVPTPSEKLSIAVLPFDDLSPQGDQGYFCMGMMDAIIAKLSRIKDWRIIPRTTMAHYKESDRNLQEIGQELNVEFILEGSLAKEKENIRVISSLFDVRDRSSIWTQDFERKLEGLLSLQSEIAEKITEALKMELSPEEKARLEEKPTESITAYDYYLRGLEYYRRYQKQDNDQAIQLFNKALEVDRDFALAYSGLGDAYAQAVYRFGSPHTWYDRAIDASQTAISIDPDCAEAYKTLGLVYFYKGWARKSIEANRNAIEINPNLDYALISLALVYLFTGELEKVFPLAEKGLALIPTDPWPYHLFAFYYYFLDDIAKVKQWEMKSLELRPDFNDSHVVLIVSYLVQGQIHEAVEQSQKLLFLLPGEVFPNIWAGEAALFAGDIPQARHYYEKTVEKYVEHLNAIIGIRNSTRLGYIYWISGERKKAQELFDLSLRLDQDQIKSGDEFWRVWNDMAAIYAVLGDKEEAYRRLKKSIEAGFLGYRFSLIEPMFENLRDEKNFKQMMADVKQSVDKMRERLEKKN